MSKNDPKHGKNRNKSYDQHFFMSLGCFRPR